MLCSFSELHLDVARNSTDDFNLFHDKNKWQQVENNPFSGPILLGFQLEMLLEGAMRAHRLEQNEAVLIAEQNLLFSNYQFSFANAVRPDQQLEVAVKKSLFKPDPTNPVLGNRISVKADSKLCLIGYKKESRQPLFLATPDLPDFSLLNDVEDRSFLPDSGYFVKRKFMTTSNAKNFLCSSLQPQADYFDEVEGKIEFPEIFPCALLSSALLEKAVKEQLDFKQDPLIYTSHKLSVNREFIKNLKSNDCLQILVRQTAASLAQASNEQEFECYGVVNQQHLLFRGLITLIPI